MLTPIVDYPYSRYSETNRNCKMNNDTSLTIQGHAKEMDTPLCWIILWEQNNLSDSHQSGWVLAAILKPVSLTEEVTSLCPLKYFILFVLCLGSVYGRTALGGKCML